MLVSDRPLMLSIDPGTNHLGIAISNLSLATKKMEVIEAYTVDINYVAKLYASHIELCRGQRSAKMYAVYYLVQNLLRSYPFSVVACESPYMGRFPAAFSALVECLANISTACQDYNQRLPLFLYDPATVKRALGVKGTSSDKNAVAQAVARCPSIDTSQIYLSYCDEHTTDAIGVGHACLLSIAG